MNGFDLGAGLLSAFGFARGRKRGLGLEIYRSIMIGIPIVAGCGLFKMASSVLSAIPGLGGEHAGFAGFLGVVVGSIAILRVLRKKLRTFLINKFDRPESRTAAGMVGLVRYGLISLGIIAGVELSPADALTENSILAKLFSREVKQSDL